MGRNNNLQKLKEEDWSIFEKYARLPSIHDERAFSLDGVEERIEYI